MLRLSVLKFDFNKKIRSNSTGLIKYNLTQNLLTQVIIVPVKNEIGNIYGYLTVISRAKNTKEGKAQWLCKCKCGNEVVACGTHLRLGDTKSCGCYQKEKAIEANMRRADNLIGCRFGKLMVLSEAGFATHPSGKRNRLYNCLCDCGNYCQVQHQYLAGGDTTSCGCIRSKMELIVNNYLLQHGYDFKKEYYFDDLRDKASLRFDFALFNNAQLLGLIECQGEQHFNKMNGYYSEDIVRHDKMKQEYCFDKKIKLCYILYNDDVEKRLEEILSELYSK